MCEERSERFKEEVWIESQEENKERSCGLRVGVKVRRKRDLPFDLYRLLLFWQAENAFYVY